MTSRYWKANGAPTRQIALRSVIIGSAAIVLSACVSSAPTPAGLITQAQADLEQQANPSLNESTIPPDVAAAPSAPQAPGAPADESLTAQVRTSVEAAAAYDRIAAADNAPDADASTPSLVAAAPSANADEEAAGADNAIPNTATALAPAPTAARPGNGGFFGSLFGQGNTPRPAAAVQEASGEAERRARAKQRMRQRANAASQRSVQVASAAPRTQSRTTNGNLPGVKRRDLFGTIFGDNDKKANKAADVQVASVAGFARISRNGLLRQHEGVRVSCFKPSLMRILKQVENRFGKKVIVTSGYRSPKENRRAGGARNSRHTFCDAADIQVAGVSKWTLAKYLRTLPTRGGVGTYCHTKSVHIDTYKKRDWNWACRKRKRRRG